MTATLNFSIDRTDKIISLKQELEKLEIIFLKPDINFSKKNLLLKKTNQKNQLDLV